MGGLSFAEEAWPLLTLRTLGPINLLDSNGSEITPILSQTKRFAVFIFLALAKPQGFHRRDTLLTLFWPGRDAARARNALSQSLAYLRQHLPGEVIVRRGAEEVRLAPDLVAADVHEFQAAIQDRRWAEALEWYGGDFLPGFHVGDAWGFEEWLEGQRTQLREAAAGAAWALAQEQIAEGGLVGAERTAQRALKLAWAEEGEVRRFIEALAKAGDGPAALTFYHRFCEIIQDKLGLDASPETQAVVEAIQNGDLSPTNSVSVTEVPRLERPVDSTSSAQTPGPDESDQRGPWRFWFWSLVAAATVCLSAVGFLRVRWNLMASQPPPPDRPFTVLAAVGGGANQEAKGAVAFLLRNSLDMSHLLQTVPLTETEHVLGLMERNPNAPLDPALAREVAARLGVVTVVLPRLDHFDGRHVLALRVEDVRDGVLRAQGRGVAETELDIVQMVDEVAMEVRRRLGENRAVLANSERLPQVLTPSLQALEDYRLGYQLFVSGEVRAAVTPLRRAVTTDTAFAAAWIILAQVYGHLDRADSADLANQQVLRFQSRLTEARLADRVFVHRMRNDVAQWDDALAERGQELLRNWRHIDDYAVHIAGSAGLPDSALNLYMSQAAREAAQAQRLNPARRLSECWVNPILYATSTDRVQEWISHLDSIGTDIPPDCFRNLSYFESLADADWDLSDSLHGAGQGEWRWAGTTGVASRQLNAVRGRFGTALEELSLAVDRWQDSRATISWFLLGVGYDNLPVFSPPEIADSSAFRNRELETRGSSEVHRFVLHGVREALFGDTLEGQRVKTRLQAMRDTATSQAFENSYEPWFVLMDVGPAARRGDWETVITLLEPMVARIHQPGVGDPLSGDAYLGWWILADAYVQSGRPELAIPNLESILVRPRARVWDWVLQGFIHPPTRLKLGRLYTETGDTQKAREHYQAFLDTFTDPDPEFAWMVEEARAGLAASGG